MVLHNKLKEKRGSLPPAVRRYFAGEELEDRWICYPWDALDIEEHERAVARRGAERGAPAATCPGHWLNRQQ